MPALAFAKRLLIGAPLSNERMEHERLNKKTALASLRRQDQRCTDNAHLEPQHSSGLRLLAHDKKLHTLLRPSLRLEQIHRDPARDPASFLLTMDFGNGLARWWRMKFGRQEVRREKT